MTTIDEALRQIRTAVYGKEVRTAIADGIELSYDMVSGIKNAYDDIKGTTVSVDLAASNWSNGSFDPDTGETSGSSTLRLRYNSYADIPAGKEVSVSITDLYQMILYFYDSDHGYIRNTGDWAGNATYIVPEGAAYIRIVMRRKDNGSISTSVPSGNVFTITMASAVTKLISEYFGTPVTVDPTPSEWHIGTISMNDGTNSGTSTLRIRTNGYIQLPANSSYLLVLTARGYQVGVMFYDESQDYISCSNNLYDTPWVENKILTIPSGALYVRLTFKRSDNEAFVSSASSTITAPQSGLIEMYCDSVIQAIINEHHSTIGSYINFRNDPASWHSGTIDAETGVNSGTSSLRIRGNDYYELPSGTQMYVEIDSTYMVSVFFYTLDKGHISNTGWTSSKTVSVPESARYFRLTVRRSDETALTVDIPSKGILTLYMNGSYNLSEVGGTLSTLPDYLITGVGIKKEVDLGSAKTMYASLLNTSSETTDTFMFITDPHIYPCPHEAYITNPDVVKAMFATYGKAFDEMPLEFIVGGGDWLTDSYTQTEACLALGEMTATMRKLTNGKYYNLIGNHDTNYFGEVSSSDHSVGTLSKGALIRTMFPDQGRAYYRLESTNAAYYMMDTGESGSGYEVVTNYRLNQFFWLAESLLTEDKPHIGIMEHIYCSTAIDNVLTVASYVNSIITAYNGRTSVTISNRTFDYSSVTGKVEFTIAGHSHKELSGIVASSPVVVCDRAIKNRTTPSYDLVHADYGNRILSVIRAEGTSAVKRTYSLDTGEKLT